jgi:hypothetical protein
MIHGGRDAEQHLLEPGIDQLVSELEQFANHPERYRQLIEQARIWVAGCFAGSIQAEAMTRVYESLCRKKSIDDTSLSDWYARKRGATEMSIANDESLAVVASA